MTANRFPAGLTGVRLLLLLVGLVAIGTRADEPGREKTEAEAMGQAAEADRLFKTGDFAAALPLYEAERSSRATLGDLRYEAYAARAIGCCHDRLGDLEAAIAAWKAALALDSKREDRGFAGYDRFLIGQAQLQLDRAQEGVESLKQALPLLSQAVDRDHEADARLLLAYALTEQGEPAQASPHLERALELARALDDRSREATTLAQMGHSAMVQGTPGPAAEWLSEARELFLGLGDEDKAAAMDRSLGDALLALDLPKAALARVELAAEAHEQLEEHALLADDLQFLAGIKLDQRNLPAARKLARRAVKAYQTAGDAAGEVAALVRLARGQSLANDWTTAAATLTQALELARQQGEPAEQVRLLILAAGVERNAKRIEQSTGLLDEAEAIAQEADNGALKRMVAEAKQELR